MNALVNMPVSLPGDVELYHEFWIAVLKENLRVALGILGGTPNYQAQAAQASVVIKRGEAWIGSEGFHEVCSLAGFDAVLIERWFRSEVQKPEPGAMLRRGLG